MSAQRANPARRFVAALFGTLKLMQMYGATHAATFDALRNLGSTIAETTEEGEVRLSVRGSRVQVNGRTMRASDCGSLALTFLADEWNRRAIEHVRFSRNVPADELAQFAAAFLRLELEEDEPGERLRLQLTALGCQGVHVEKREADSADPILMEERRENAMRTYMRGLRAFKDVLRLDGVSDRTKVRRARRAVQGLVDNFLEDETAVLALAQIRGYDVKLFHHSLNVCIHALLIGQRLGMTRRQLGELGLAALFHDLGKTIEPEEGEKGRGHWKALRAHPARGAMMLLAQGTAHEGTLKSAIAAYEHHAHYDRSGFPALDHEPHLVSRVVAIADCYEALTGPRPYREVPYTPYDALSLMQARAGSLFDPLLLKVFVNALGAYPVGSLVELSSGEIAIVVDGPAGNARLSSPRVKIVRTEGGILEPETMVDLAEGPQTVVRTLASHEVFPSVGDYVSVI